MKVSGSYEQRWNTSYGIFSFSNYNYVNFSDTKVNIRKALMTI